MLTKTEKRNIEQEKKYRQILKDLKPLQKKHGIPALKWALTKWTSAMSKQNSLIKQKAELEEQIQEEGKKL